jgi:cbb3-type cytochrome oxidase cytochrome c subunit
MKKEHESSFFHRRKDFRHNDYAPAQHLHPYTVLAAGGPHLWISFSCVIRHPDDVDINIDEDKTY